MPKQNTEHENLHTVYWGLNMKKKKRLDLLVIPEQFSLSDLGPVNVVFIPVVVVVFLFHIVLNA